MMPRIRSTRGARLALFVVLAACAPSPARAESSPAALALADRVVDALGGRAAWDRTGYLTFDFVVSRNDTVLSRRTLAWDRATDRIHVALKDAKGKAYDVWTNLAHEDGVVRVDGAAADSATKAQWLKRAYAIWVNDTYWLLMPYKMKDPGVTLAYDGEERKGAETWDKVVLTFDNVGLTPKDKYWVYVNRATGLVDKWEYILGGGPGPPTPFAWKGWARHGAILLASDRVSPLDDASIHFPILEAPGSVPDRVFTSP